MSQAFAEFHAPVGLAAVQHIIRELRFPPCPADVYTAFGEASHHYRIMDYLAQQYLEEHRKRAEDEVQRNRVDAFRRGKAKRNIERRIDKYDAADDYQSMCRLSDALRDLKRDVVAGCRPVPE